MSILSKIKKIFNEVEDIELSIPTEELIITNHLRNDLQLDSLSIMALFSELQIIYPNLREDALEHWFTIDDIIKSIDHKAIEKNKYVKQNKTNSKLILDDSYIEDFEVNEKKQILAKNLEEFDENQIILLIDKNPLNQMLSFIVAIENKLVPIMLSHEMPKFQLEQIRNSLGECSSIINGKCHKGSITSPYKNSFGSLTSGTTGNPKILYFSIDKAKDLAKLHCQSIGIDRSIHLIQCLPLYHIYGVVCYILSWLELGFELHLKTNFMGLKQIQIKSHYPLVIYTSPSQIKFLLKENMLQTFKIKAISVGGGSIDKKYLSEISKIAPSINIYTTYGLSEAGPRVSTGKYNNQVDGFIGTPLDGIQVKVLNEKQEVSNQGSGQLLVKTPFEAINKESLDLLDGFIKTRDHVVIEPNSEIIFKSREDDLINIGGVSIYPKDIELIAVNIEGVTDALVLKKYSELHEEVPILIIESELNKEEIMPFLTQKLTLKQIPKKIYSIKKFPRFSLDKIDRQKLLLWIGENE